MIIAIISAFLLSADANAQLVVTEATSNAEVEQYIEDVLLGSCVTVSNFSYTGQAWGSGTFDGTASNLGMDAGILLSTGRASFAVGPDNVNDRSHNQGNGGDADLDQLLNFGFTTEDAVVLEFDFIPQDDTLRFNYIFASEEYPEYVNSSFNDVFGFFISGPGYNGPFSNNAENIALVPGTTLPVAIDNINNGQTWTEPSSGPCNNCAYYVDNSSGTSIQYDAFTTVLTAMAVVVPCSTYHIKMAVADATDHIYDSGVFLQEGSFSAGGGVSVEIETSNIPPGIYEGCNDAWFVFRRLDLLNNGSPITADFTITGTATAGVDYTALPTTITIPAGEDSLLVNIEALFDGITEGTETIILTLDDPPCSCQAPESAIIDILDNDIPLAVTTTGSTTICVGQSANLTANPSGSQTPYSQTWDNGLGTGLNQTVSPTNTTTYTFTVSDACGGQTVQSSETVTVVRGDFTIDDDEQCFQGNLFNFTNTGTSNGTVSHYWDFGDGSGTSTQENPTYSYSNDGSYTVTHHVIFTAAGCTTSVTANVEVWEMPSASMASTDLVCAGDDDGTATVTASNGTAPYSYAWSPGGETTATITGLEVGTYNVTVTDDNGCTANDQAIIIQNDPIPPSAVCQNLTVQLDATGNVGISATQIDNGSSDNCGIASMVVFPNTFDCSNVGNNTVTLTVTDVNGNQSICNATVTVQDNIAPTAICQDISVSLDAAGNATITSAQVNNGSTDNCGIQSLAVNPSSFDCADVGANTVTLTVTDVNGNVSTCNATVTVLDDTPPAVSCNNITVQLDATGNVSIVLADIDNGASDNCGIASQVLSPSSFDCSDVGANVVTVTVTDNAGNSTICTSTVTVEDVIPPTVNCNDINVYLDANGSASISLADVDGGASDNCGIASSALSPSNFNCGDVGPNNVNVTVWDVNGNTANCNSTVTVIDTVSPNALCQNITVQLDATGNASISANSIDAGSTDNCGIATRVLDITTFDCSDVGANTVTLTVTDVNGNVDVCTATVTVEDNVDPTAICQNITVELDATGNVSITSANVDNGSSDNCGIQSMTVNPSTFTCANVGLNVVTLTVTDVNGNVSTCTSNVTVEDNINPTVICNSITVQTDVTGNVSITAADVDGGSFDNCGLASLTVVPTTFDCNDLGPNTVTLTAIDFSGNVSTCTATVTVEDNLPPTAICQNITAQLNPSGSVTIAAGDIDNGSTDPCGLQSITVVPSTFDCTDIGANTVTLTVTDISGNVSTCTAIVNVVDEVIPIALCQDITVYLDATGNVSIEPEDIDNGSNDACGSVSAITVVPNTFDCGDQGGNAVTLTVEDSNGNQAICVATVTVVDDIPPTPFCQDITVQLNALGQASITPAMIDNGSFDNCAIVSYSVTPNQFNCSNVGANTVTMTVIDDAGNSSTCTATVTVEDNIAPNPICRDITVQLNASGNVSITAAQVDNGSTDNCAVQSISVTPNSFTCAAVGANPVTLTVTDASGNTATCTATVTVQDNVNPTAICQNISVQLDATGNVTILPSQIDNGSNDACGIASLALNNDSFDCSNIGPNTVILTVTDVNGNVSTCTSTVTVEEDMPPTALCQDITVQLDAAGNVTVAAIDVDNGSFDNCSSGGALTYALAPNTFDCDDVGVVTATLTVTDANGNSSACTADITIEDNVPPIATCQDITIQLDAAGNASIVPSQIDNGSSDNCGIANMSVNPNTFTCAAVGANPVTLTVTDFYGNVSTCSATVTVQDNVPPVAICQDITVQLDASGNATITASQIDNGSNDACGVASLTINNSSFDCSDVGPNTVTLTVVDVNGNSSTCTSTVTVEDNVAPNALCQDITIQLDASGNASITAAQIDNGSNDACGIASLSVSPSTFDCSNVGANAVVLTVTDNNGNVSTCNATVTVEDNVNPTAICQDITVQLDAVGSATITAAQIDNGSNDACGIQQMTVNPANFNCSDVGSNTVTLTVTDNNGNVSTCTATVTVQEVIPPVALCQDITIQLDATGNATITPNDVDNGSNDECGLSAMTVTPNAFTCADEGTNTVTLTVTDNFGNTSSCTATVTVENNVNPTVGCQDITVYLDASGNVTIDAEDVNSGSNASCGLASLTVDPSAFDCTNIGANTVTLTATDNSGNVSTCTAVVTVQDTVSPVAICQDITIQLDATGNASIVAADVDNGSNDACGIDNMTVSPSTFECIDVGANTVVLTVTDNNGNTSTCSATVTVEDNVPPTAVCQDITVQLDPSGNVSINPAQIDAGSDDACGIDFLTVTPNTFDCSNVGANTVTFTATDNNGNSSTCTTTVTVEDDVPPIAICQSITIQLDASGNASITAAQIDNGSSDNCGIQSMTVTPNTFTCSGVGPNPVQLTVTDVNGNVSTCNATVTVEDNVPPTAVCQDITVQLDGTGNASIVVSEIDNGSDDACGVASLVLDNYDFDCTNIGPNTVTMTVTDNNGNVSTCTSTVTIEDNIDPQVVCNNITVALDATGNAVITSADIDAGSTDNCSSSANLTYSVSPNTFDCDDVGVQVVTLTITDEYGNSDFCTASVTITDDEPPTAICQDITIQLDAAGNASITAADIDNGSSDNCGIQSMSVTPSTFTCAAVGGNPVQLTVTDVNGNVSTCNATVTVEDNIPPVAICQDITVQLDATGNVNITATQIDNGSNDACGIASLAVNPSAFNCADEGANTVTLTVTDNNGNVSTCTSTVTVENNVAPNVSCQDITIQLDAFGNASITSNDVNAGADASCGLASLTVDPSTFDCSNVVDSQFTITAVYISGIVSTCTAIVTVEDNVNPTAICQDITVQLDGAGNASIVAADVDNGSNDACGIQSMTVTPNTFDCTNLGANTVTLTVTDVNGNSSICIATVTVEDNVDPSVICQNITVQLDANGNAVITAVELDGGSTDNCSSSGAGFSYSVDQTDFDCSNVGSNIITLTVTDAEGNSSTCTGNVEVEDNVPPIAVCQDIIVQLNATGNATIAAGDVDNGSSDNCGIASITVSPSTFTCAEVGPNSVTLTVTDVHGNVSTCSATVTVEDNVVPEALCQDITVQLDATGNVNIAAAQIDNGSNDACGIQSLSVSPDSFDCDDIGVNGVVLTVTDVNGNVSVCNADVTVEDEVDPVVICQDITVQLDANGQITVDAIQIDGGSTDNCSTPATGLTYDITPADFDCSDVGVATAQLTVTDAYGNSSTCTASITVQDNTAPTAICQDITVQLDATGNVSITAAQIDNGSFDNCGIDNMTVSPSSFTCAGVGDNPVTLTVTDVNGNVSTCVATVTVEDNVPPVAICQDITVQLDATGNVSITSTQIDNGSNDACGIQSMTVSPDSFTCAEEGPNTVTLTVTDVNGNVSTCTSTVTVENNVVPNVFCQDITVYLDATGNVNIIADDVNGGSNAACGLQSLVVSPDAFDCSNVGANTVTLTATDNSGNVSSCNATVTVLDTINPIAICQDITIQLDATGNAVITAADVDGGSVDNCGILNILVDGGATQSFDCGNVGTNTVTLTVTDVNGNVSTCDATVTVEDNVNPTAICQDITVQLDANGNVTIQSVDIDGGSFDNCGIASITVDGGATSTDFDCSNVGANTVTLTVTDVNGNVSTCDATVTVEDNVDPTAICQDITVQLDANGNVTIQSVDIDGGSFDNCGIASITVDGGNTDMSFDCSNVGMNTVTLTVTDVNGNVSTCDATVTVEDNVDPTAICQDITVQLDANGNVTIQSVDIDGGSFDNCGIASVTVDGGSTSMDFDCSSVGTNTVTLTVTDVNGNVSTCDAIVTVEDNVNPTAICQDITIQLDATGNVTIQSIDIDGGSTDNCGIASITVDGGNTDMSFDCSNVGANTVTLTVTDVNGNVSTCDATVTVEDNVDPTAICQDITVQLDANGNVTIQSVDIDGGSFDNCGIASISVDGGNTDMSFDCSNVGANTVTLTVTDVNGNVSTCDATVTVEDNVDPTAICQDITVQLDANGNVTIQSVDIDGGSFDNCGIASITVDGGSTTMDFDCSSVGTNTVTLTVTDVNGNVSTCDATVTVEDNVDPIAICQDITIQLDANGNATIQSIDIDGGSTDNCGIASVTVDGSQTTMSFDCSDEGVNIITLTVTDVNGNVSTCDATVTVENNVTPNVVCQDITVYLDASGNVSIIADDVNGGTNAACGIADLQVSPSDFDCSNVGPNTVTLTATDNSGNISTCDALVTVVDTISPIAICQDITVQLDANGNVTIQSVDINGGSTDNCDIASITVNGGATSTDFDCSNVGANTVTLTVTDVNGNISTCDAIVTVEDTVSPTAICQDITVQLDANGNVTIQSVDIDGGSFDNCGVASITVDGGATSTDFDCSNVGANTVTLTVTDVNGNVSTCDATVTVEDNVDPTAICQDITVQLDANGNVTIQSVDIDGGSFDNCGIASITVDGGATSTDFDCSNVGTNTVTLTVTDVNGNISTCDATVTVEDTISPTAICQDITVQLDATGNVTIQSVDIDGGSFDNCGIASVMVDGGSNTMDFNCFNVGINIVTLTVTDVNGNVSTCDATVTVEDNVDPIAICQDITVQLDSTGNVAVLSTDIDGGSSDNCGIASIEIDGAAFQLFDCTNVGTNTVTLTVTDVNGNTSTCTATITVEDNVAPEVICQDITVYLDATGNVSITSEQVDGGSTSACGVANLSVSPSDFTCSGVGVNPVTLTVTDNNGNVSTCQANVTVIDTINPIAICQDITVQLNQNGVASIDATQIDNGSNDACGIDNIAIDIYNFDCSNVGANTVTLTVTDNNGNVSTCTSTVTIEDNVPPVTLCQGATIYLDSLGSAEISAYTLDNGSNDACGVDTILINQSIYDCSELGVNQGIITVIDVNGNSATCQSDVNVMDTIAPYFIDCPADITVVPDSNNCEPVVTWIPPTGMDNCTPSVSSTHNPGDNFPVGTTTVTYTVIDQSGNMNTCSFNVTIEPVQLMVSLTSPEYECGFNISCNGLNDGSIDSYVSGGCLPYSYQWNNGQTGESATNLTAGTYDVTVTDINGNQATASITLTEPDPLVITSITPTVYEGGWNISCAGGSDGGIQAQVSGGANCEPLLYSWIDANWMEVSASSSVSGLSAGTYYLRVGDVNSCDAFDSIYLAEPDSLELIFNLSIYNGDHNVSCAGASDGSIDLTVLNGTPPYSVSWDNGETSEDLSGLEAGTYVATVTDANGCEIVGQITLIEPDELSSSITSPEFNGYNISCQGLEDGSLDLTVAGGTGPYLFMWSNGAATEDLTDLAAGMYIVTITDANGCTHVDSVLLTQPDELILSSLDTGLIDCFGDADGSLTVGADGGVPSYTYTWSNGATGATALNLVTGLYTAYVEDLNGCTDSLLLQLDEPLELVAQINSQIDVSCYQGSNGLVDVSVTGGTAPYSYQWTNGDQTEDLNGVSAGTYTLTVTDANQCQTQLSAIVDEPTDLVVAVDSVVDVTCAGLTNGQAWIVANGGTQPYTYLWSTGHTTDFVIGLSAGIHQVTVTDDNGCTEVVQVEVNEPPVLFANLNLVSSVSCNGGTDGVSQVEVIGGVAPYTYLWSNGDTLDMTDSLDAGSHYVIITDANGCDTTINFIMDQPASLNVITALAQDPACFGDSTGLIQVAITGGTEPYYPLWENGQTTLQADGFGAGDHMVVVTDYNGCLDSLTITLGEPTQLTIANQVVIEPLCNGSEDGSATVIVQGGVAPYFYNWDPSGSTSASANNIGAGEHIITITDQQNCVLTDTLILTQPDPVVAVAIADTTICPADTALVWAEGQGGAGNYSYLWNEGLGIAQGADVVPALTTEYIVVVTDSAGCSSAPDTMVVNVAPLPQPSFTYTSPDFCAYPVQLDMENTTVGGVTYDWFFGNGDVSDNVNPSVAYDDPGSYTITLIAYSDIGCTDTTSQVYEASEVPTASFSMDGMEGCSPVVVSFQDFSEHANTYLWDFGDGTTSVLPDPSHIYDNPGEYDISLVVTTQGGCTDTMMLGAGVSVWPSPIADFTAALFNPDSGAVYEFTNLSVGAIGYEWDFGDGQSSNFENPYHEFLTNGNVDVLLIAVNEHGCIDTALHTLEIDVFAGLMVPNALAYGELGEAGLFLPKGTGISRYRAMVFDEWGNLLWESSALENGSPAEGWDGTFKGTAVPQGSYVWKVDAEFGDGHVWEGMKYGPDKFRNTGSITVLY